MERHEYDGAEWWEFKRLPDVSSIPYGDVLITEWYADRPVYILGKEEKE